MKRQLTILLAISFTWSSTACTGSDNNESAQQPAKEKTAGAQQSSSEVPEDIVGEWEQILVVNDRNGNNKLDEEERKNGMTNLKDYMKLNSDGTAVFLIMKAEGRYEFEVNKTNGRKYLHIYSKDNTKYKKGYVVSVTKEELIMGGVTGGSAFTVWKRL